MTRLLARISIGRAVRLVCMALLVAPPQLLSAASSRDYESRREAARVGAMPQGLTGGQCVACHCREEGFEFIDANGEGRSLYVDDGEFRASVHGQFDCEGCHWEVMTEKQRPKPPDGQVVSEEWLQEFIAPYPERGRRVLRICASCHRSQAEVYAGSIHAKAVREGIEEAPVCVDCHGTHTIRAEDDLESSVGAANVPATCAHCHADATRMARANVTTATVTSYEESFHGKKSNLGGRRAAVCSSCHGAHEILAPSDPHSRLSKQNRVATCAECHEGASEEFAFSFTHALETREEKPIMFYLKWFYRLAILGTIGGMSAYIGLDLLRRGIDQRRERRARHHRAAMERGFPTRRKNRDD